MQNVPKIVRQRLKAAMPAVNHPDADVLTAFAEQSLPELERMAVLEHMARCGDCRDIVALALPAMEPIERAVSPSSSGWLTWPALRWGFVAAAVVAIASFGILQYQRLSMRATGASKQSGHLEVAANEPKKAVTPFVAAPNETRDQLESPAAPAFADSVDRTDAVDEKKSVTRAEASPVRALPPQAGGGSNSLHRSTAGGSLPHGPRLANQWQQQNTAQNQAPMPAPPSAYSKQQNAGGDLSANGRAPAASETVEVSGEAANIATQTQDSDTGQGQPIQQSSAGEPSVAKAKAPVTVKTESAPSTQPVSGVTAQQEPTAGRNFAQLSALSPSLQPRWTINASGGLQRSFDQGNTWQTVDVAANPASFSFTGGTSLEVVSKTSRAKAAKQKDTDKAHKQDGATLTFRAVAATGSDVWAGGSPGVLYHSLDAGDHWTRIVPSAAGAILTGDVISLEFADPQHGTVSTSSSEVWTTTDDGQTWRKQ
jgi:photosynthesis system II assembly factor YCF48-like protein/putative zinc finger protein